MRSVTFNSEGKITEELKRYGDANELSEVRITVANHFAVDNPGCSPGIDQLLEVAHTLRGSPSNDPTSVVLAVSDHGQCEIDHEYSNSLGIRNISLTRMLDALPEIEEALSANPRLSSLNLETVMRYHAEVVHFGRYLAAHNIAFDEIFENTSLQRRRMISKVLSPDRLEAAAAIDGAIGQFMLNYQVQNPGISILNDWPGLLATSNLSGDSVKHDVISNHCVVPPLSSILSQPPVLRDYQLRVFETMARGATVTVLHTERDADNLGLISDYVGIPFEARGVIFVREMIPSCFTKFDPCQVIEPHPLIQAAVESGKFIAVIAERLDFVKMDPALMHGLLELIDSAANNPELLAKLRLLRVAMIAVPSDIARDEDSALYSLYSGYNLQVDGLIERVNARYRAISGDDQEFLIVHRDMDGDVCGLDRDLLRSQIYPFAHLAIQVGQEGLCLSVQESALVRAFSRNRYPVVQLVSSAVGFSEKARTAGLLNVVISENSKNSENLAQALEAAVDLTFKMNNPGETVFRDKLVLDLKEYFRSIGTSYFGGTLELLNDRMQEQHWLQK